MAFRKNPKKYTTLFIFVMVSGETLDSKRNKKYFMFIFASW